MYEHTPTPTPTSRPLSKFLVQLAKSPCYYGNTAIEDGSNIQLSTTIERSTSFVHSPWLYISSRNPKRTISLPKVQPPLALELHQTLRKNHPIDLTLCLLRRTRPKEGSFKPRDRPVRKLRLICPSNNWVLNASVDGRTEGSTRIDEHLAH